MPTEFLLNLSQLDSLPHKSLKSHRQVSSGIHAFNHLLCPLCFRPRIIQAHQYVVKIFEAKALCSSITTTGKNFLDLKARQTKATAATRILEVLQSQRVGSGSIKHSQRLVHCFPLRTDCPSYTEEAGINLLVTHWALRLGSSLGSSLRLGNSRWLCNSWWLHSLRCHRCLWKCLRCYLWCYCCGGLLLHQCRTELPAEASKVQGCGCGVSRDSLP
mmetsp:Transcript_94513/g.173138  ORF Transcript_94513/g.173138 Transcript_94513/m.173138 type:complete len:216 (-) Transcript_94513:1141-1788(-)